MLAQQELNEVEPGLRHHEVNEAVRMIMQTNWLGEQGLILAFQETKYPCRNGFSLLTHRRGDYAWLALYAETSGKPDPLRFGGIIGSGISDSDEFITTHLKKTAELMRTSYANFFNEFVERSSLWRFRGYVDGKLADYADNSFAWRALWGRLIEVVAPGRLQVEGMGEQEIAQFAHCLHHHATNGQIILDR